MKNMSLKNSNCDAKTAKSNDNPSQTIENKENSSPAIVKKDEKSTEIVGTSAPSVGSAIDLVNSASASNRPPLIKSTNTDSTHNNKQRTVSSSAVVSIPTVQNKKQK